MLKPLPIFLGILLLSTVMCTLIWDTVLNGSVYDCTDDAGFGFLNPGDWVHGDYEIVSELTTDRSMSEKDTLLHDWSEQKLWFRWSSLLLIAIILSTVTTLFLQGKLSTNHLNSRGEDLD